MVEKTGKISLIIGAVLSILFFTLGFVIENTGTFSHLINRIYYPILAMIPAFLVLFSHLLGWIIALKIKKKTETPEEKTTTVAILFKTYFYLLPILSIIIIIGSFIFTNFTISDSRTTIAVAMILSSAVWFSVMLTSVLVWAAYNAWKANELVGVIVGVVALLIFIGSVAGIGIVYVEMAQKVQYVNDDSWWDEIKPEDFYDNPESETDTDVEADSSNYEVGFDTAYDFFIKKLDLPSESNAVSLIKNWQYYNWRDENYDNRFSDKYDTRDDFEKCSYSFYNLYDESYNNSDKLLKIYNYYAENNDDNAVSKELYKKCGAKDCVKALLSVHDDIYSNSNKNTVLKEMYDIMAEDCPSEYSSNELVEYRYPKLKPYMSIETLDKLKGKAAKNATEWQEQFFAAWAYSFWARRYHDGVDDAAYEILTKISNFYE